MTKSELKALIQEVINEQFDPTQGEKYHKPISKLDPETQSAVVATNAAISKLHASLKQKIQAKYGSKVKDISLYLKVDSKGRAETQIQASSNEDILGGGIDVSVPPIKMGKDRDYYPRN